MKREFTSSVYLINNQTVLLIFHLKLQKWLPPGGHVEANETPAEAARREVMEETGIEIEFELDENINLSYWNATSIERPYLCLLENIPHYGTIPSHQHIDFIYVARPVRIDLDRKCEYSYRWFTWEDLLELQPNHEIFQETLDVIKHLFYKFKSHSAL